MKQWMVWCLAVLLTLTGAARAEAWREIPYKDLTRIPLMLEKVDGDHVFSSRYTIEPAKAGTPLPADLRVAVLVGDRTIPVAVGPDGHLRLPVRQDWVDARARLRINQPKERLKVVYRYKARTPPGTRMRYGQLTESVQVMVRGIDEAAGLLGFLAPEPHALGLTFPPGRPQEVVLAFADGTSKRFRAVPRGEGADARNELELPWDPDWLDAQVTLDAPLRAVVPLME